MLPVDPVVSGVIVSDVEVTWGLIVDEPCAVVVSVGIDVVVTVGVFSVVDIRVAIRDVPVTSESKFTS